MVIVSCECNYEKESNPSSAVRERVPDYIYQAQKRFQTTYSTRSYELLSFSLWIHQTLNRSFFFCSLSNCIVPYTYSIQGPHTGITKNGEIGKVERPNIALVDNCCGSAIAASNYVKGITCGGCPVTAKIQGFLDFQQSAVKELTLPHGKRLDDAGTDRLKEVPYALFQSQDLILHDIINSVKKGLKHYQGTAILGGIQINTGPDTLDYFHPLRFELLNNDGEIIEDMLPHLTGEKSHRSEDECVYVRSFEGGEGDDDDESL